MIMMEERSNPQFKCWAYMHALTTYVAWSICALYLPGKRGSGWVTSVLYVIQCVHPLLLIFFVWEMLDIFEVLTPAAITCIWWRLIQRGVRLHLQTYIQQFLIQFTNTVWRNWQDYDSFMIASTPKEICTFLAILP